MAKAKAKSAETPAKKKGRGLGLKVSPDQAKEALQVLKQYVDERSLVCEKEKLGDLNTSVHLMSTLHRFKEELQSMLKSPAEKAYDRLRFTIVPSFMEDDGITSLTVEGVGRVNVMDDIQCQVADKDGLYDWLREEDMADLIQNTVNAQTLAAALRKRLKEGKPMPPEKAVKVTPITRAQITRG